jgi:hypothetical protein
MVRFTTPSTASSHIRHKHLPSPLSHFLQLRVPPPEQPPQFLQPVAVPGYENGCEGCHEVWRGCEEGLHGRGAHVKGAHDCRVEVVEAERTGDADVEGNPGFFCQFWLREKRIRCEGSSRNPRSRCRQEQASGQTTPDDSLQALSHGPLQDELLQHSSELPKSQYTPAPVLDPGKSGMKNGPMSARKAPVAGSMINSHCHPASPIEPCKLLNTPAAINPEEAMAMPAATYSTGLACGLPSMSMLLLKVEEVVCYASAIQRQRMTILIYL